MIALQIPGRGPCEINPIVFDVNGTLALDGNLIDGVAERIQGLRKHTQIHLNTANAFGIQNPIDPRIGFPANPHHPGNEKEQKAKFIEPLDDGSVIAMGKGSHITGRFTKAALENGILIREGIALKSLLAADFILPNIQSVLDCLKNPKRIIASLRI